jgi:hypothetical protein
MSAGAGLAAGEIDFFERFGWFVVLNYMPPSHLQTLKMCPRKNRIASCNLLKNKPAEAGEN